MTLCDRLSFKIGAVFSLKRTKVTRHKNKHSGNTTQNNEQKKIINNKTLGQVRFGIGSMLGTDEYYFI